MCSDLFIDVISPTSAQPALPTACPLAPGCGKELPVPLLRLRHREAPPAQDLCQTQTCTAWHDQWPLLGAQEAEGFPALRELRLVHGGASRWGGDHHVAALDKHCKEGHLRRSPESYPLGTATTYEWGCCSGGRSVAHCKRPWVCVDLRQQRDVAHAVLARSANQGVQHVGGAALLPDSVWARSRALGSGPGPTRVLPEVSSQGGERLARAGAA